MVNATKIGTDLHKHAGFIQGVPSEMRGSFPSFTGPPANAKGNCFQCRHPWRNCTHAFWRCHTVGSAEGFSPPL